MRVVIADDSVLLREGLSALLTGRGHDVAARVGDAEALLTAVAVHRPHLAVVDVRMPPTHTDEGARAAVQLRATHPRLGVLVLSNIVSTTHATALAGQPGFGYLLKDRILDVDDFLHAAARVADGGSALDPAVVARLLRPGTAPPGLDALTDRERGVLALVAEGRSNRAIAGYLFLTERTVETHVGRIFTKLGLASTPDDHRRVRAVLTYLDATAPRPIPPDGS